MTSTAVLGQEVTQVTPRAVMAQGRPVLTVEGAFHALRLTIMSKGTRQRLKREAEREAYRKMMGTSPTNRDEILGMGWLWHFGDYDLATGTFKALNYYGLEEVDVQADPIFVSMTTSLDRELAQVPGISYRFEVESFWSDPIGGVVITSGGVTRKYRYYAWDGNRTTWPPSRG